MQVLLTLEVRLVTSRVKPRSKQLTITPNVALMSEGSILNTLKSHPLNGNLQNAISKCTKFHNQPIESQPSLLQSINQSINQSIYPPTIQPTNQSTNQPTNQSTNQPTK